MVIDEDYAPHRGPLDVGAQRALFAWQDACWRWSDAEGKAAKAQAAAAAREARDRLIKALNSPLGRVITLTGQVWTIDRHRLRPGFHEFRGHIRARAGRRFDRLRLEVNLPLIRTDCFTLTCRAVDLYSIEYLSS